MIVFMGTPEFAIASLKMLLEKKYDVGLVVCQPDKKVGRKKEVVYSPVKQFAIDNNLQVFQPIRLKDEYEFILNLNPTIIITAAYGQILPKALINNVRSYNLHGSLLPKYRGGAPIQHALFNNDDITGVTLMEMVYKMDAGDMIAKSVVTIDDSDDYYTLSNKLSIHASSLLEKNIDKLINNTYDKVAQNEEEVTFAYNLKKEDEYLDLNNTLSYNIGRIRGLSPNIGGTICIEGTNYKIYKAKKSDIIDIPIKGSFFVFDKKLLLGCLDGAMEILTIQQEGKKVLSAKDFINGVKNIKTLN